MSPTRWPSCSLALALLVACQPDAATKDVGARAPDPALAIAAARATLEAGDVQGAAQAAWVLVEAHPDRLDARLVLASAQVLQGRHDEALAQADAALRIDADSADAHANRGAALLGLGRHDEALRATEAALERLQGHQGALRNAARLHASAGRWLAEKAALETLSRLRPADAEVLLLLARNRAHAGDLPEAQRAIEAAIERAPDNPALHTFAATVLYEQDRLLAAMDRADIALRLEAGRHDARMVLEAAFYVQVASKLRCAHGSPPWPEEATTRVLEDFGRRGLRGDARFRSLHATYGATPEVVARVKRVGGCDQATP
ncbi:MAG: tetratricopeptide repeat protein [Myxococcota bacterium]|jgi:tetratricopeptide (TPR) repeat protein|nr:tetratricopeptide repeat protein [Myxococcota bacterium]